MFRFPSPTQKPLLCRALALTLFFTLYPISFSQQSQDDDADIVRVNTDLVVLNLTVTDQSQKYVRGLKRADFKVLEDGREQVIANFSAEELPFAAVVLLDTSGSMEQRLSLARSAAIRFLEGLREEDVAAVYRFDSKIEQVQDFSSSRDLAPVAFGLRADGMTVLNDAVVRAAQELSKRSEKRRAIIVLSDGMDTRSRASADKALAAAIAIGATVYAVDMSADGGTASRDRQNAAVLRNFSNKSGGRYVATPGGPAMREAFASIVEELGNQYTIGYRPSNSAHDGRWRAIEVKPARAELSVRTRKGYRAPKN